VKGIPVVDCGDSEVSYETGLLRQRKSSQILRDQGVDMPLYEYLCRDCGQVSEFLVKTISGVENQSCQHCGSTNTEKLLAAPMLLKGNTTVSGQTCCGRTERCETPPVPQTGDVRDIKEAVTCRT